MSALTSAEFAQVLKALVASDVEVADEVIRKLSASCGDQNTQLAVDYYHRERDGDGGAMPTIVS